MISSILSKRVVKKALVDTTKRALSTNNSFCDLSGKVIVVAGAGNPPEEGHGIGATTSLILARRRAKVVSVSNVDVNANTITNCILQEGNEVS